MERAAPLNGRPACRSIAASLWLDHRRAMAVLRKCITGREKKGRSPLGSLPSLAGQGTERQDKYEGRVPVKHLLGPERASSDA